MSYLNPGSVPSHTLHLAVRARAVGGNGALQLAPFPLFFTS